MNLLSAGSALMMVSFGVSAAKRMKVPRAKRSRSSPSESQFLILAISKKSPDRIVIASQDELDEIILPSEQYPIAQSLPNFPEAMA